MFFYSDKCTLLPPIRLIELCYLRLEEQYFVTSDIKSCSLLPSMDWIIFFYLRYYRKRIMLLPVLESVRCYLLYYYLCYVSSETRNWNLLHLLHKTCWVVQTKQYKWLRAYTYTLLPPISLVYSVTSDIISVLCYLRYH